MLKVFQEDECESRERRITCISLTLNLIFGCLLVLWLVLTETVIFKDEENYDVTILAEVNLSLTAALIIYAVMSVERQVKAAKRADFYASEKIIRVHAWIFVIFIITGIG